MRSVIIVAIFILYISSCKEKDLGNGIICELGIDKNKTELTVDLINKMNNDVYLTSDFSLEIYKLDSNDLYIDWTDVFLSNRIALDPYMNKTFNEITDKKIRPHLYSTLLSKYLQSIEVSDSLTLLWIRDQVELYLKGLMFVEKGDGIKQKLDLYPLKQASGSFKLVYSYKPKTRFGDSPYKFDFPKYIDDFKRLDDHFQSDTLFIRFE